MLDRESMNRSRAGASRWHLHARPVYRRLIAPRLEIHT